MRMAPSRRVVVSMSELTMMVLMMFVSVVMIGRRGLVHVMAGCCSLPSGMCRLQQAELGRRDASPQDLVGHDRAVVDGQAAQCFAQRVERQAQVEQCAQQHVA